MIMRGIEMKYSISNKGFTLIEVLMVIVLLGIVGATVSSLLFQGARSLEVQDKRGTITAEAALAFERMTREIRLMRCTTAGVSCNPTSSDLTAMTATEIRFVTTDEWGRGFRLNAGGLYLRDGSTGIDPEYLLAGNVSALTIEYLKADGTAAAAVGDVWRINVTMTITDGAESVDFKSSVHPRSFL